MSFEKMYANEGMNFTGVNTELSAYLYFKIRPTEPQNTEMSA